MQSQIGPGKPVRSPQGIPYSLLLGSRVSETTLPFRNFHVLRRSKHYSFCRLIFKQTVGFAIISFFLVGPPFSGRVIKGHIIHSLGVPPWHMVMMMMVINTAKASIFHLPPCSKQFTQINSFNPQPYERGAISILILQMRRESQMR